jgi:uncharacterized protein YsxB (DUF464 family)
MITAKISTSPLGRGLTVTGHANFSGNGQDIVCAGVSTIVYALMGFLENHRRELEGYTARASSGDACLLFKGGGEKVMGAWEMTLIGLYQLERRYPEYIRVETEGEYES